MIKVLFICHGNICRSTMAEFVMKELVRREGLTHEFLIQSAATSREEIWCGYASGDEAGTARAWDSLCAAAGCAVDCTGLYGF